MFLKRVGTNFWNQAALIQSLKQPRYRVLLSMQDTLTKEKIKIQLWQVISSLICFHVYDNSGKLLLLWQPVVLNIRDPLNLSMYTWACCNRSKSLPLKILPRELQRTSYTSGPARLPNIIWLMSKSQAFVALHLRGIRRHQSIRVEETDLSWQHLAPKRHLHRVS